MVGAPVGEAVDQPGIAVEVEDDGPVQREQAVEVRVRQTVWVLAGRGQGVEVDDVDEADLERREVLAQQHRGS